MKLKFTPDLAYILGFWIAAKAGPGIGVKGPADRLSFFVSEVLKQGLTSETKLLSANNRVYFYHSKYKKFFEKLEEELADRIKYFNDYAKAYFAGLFDAVGSIDEKGRVYFPYQEKNMILLNRFGFRTIRNKDIMYIARPSSFLSFIDSFRKNK